MSSTSTASPGKNRSAPGRQLVLRLAQALALPLRERNDLLLAAGYAPVHPETDLKDPAIRPLLAVLQHVLDGHLPYPATVVDRHGDLVAANQAFDLLTEEFAGAAEATAPALGRPR